MKPVQSPNDLSTSALYVPHINWSLANGTVPASFKNVVATPLIKKPVLDSSKLFNFRPISKVPFLYKSLEKIVYCQLSSLLNKDDTPEVQSGFKSCHSTDLAQLRFFNDFLYPLTLHCVAVAFDAVNHQICSSHLENGWA